MRLAATFLLSLTLLLVSGCGAAMETDRSAGRTDSGSSESPNKAPQSAAQPAAANMQKVSLEQAGTSQAAPVPLERKVIRNANLTIELDAPAEGQRKIASIAEQRGGFVVTSESRQRGGPGDVKPHEIVTMEVRVPAAQFDAIMGEIRAVGGRVTEEKMTGQDVTEEYIDLEARTRTQKALEAQLLEIMKQASKVSDAMEVQRELANVRTEIERLEGRRRFLENQTSLSTIKITLQPPAPLVGASAGGFFYSVRSALGDGVDIAVGILLVLIRLFIALIPIVLFIVLPLVLLVRFVRRRLPRRLPPTEKPVAQPVP